MRAFVESFQKVLSNPQSSYLRYEIWKKVARNDARAAAAFARGAGMQLANIFTSPILDSSKGQTLFILGSGWSVNSLTDEMIRHIGSHVSVGINFWFFHDFVPSLFSFDAGKVQDSERAHLRQSLFQLGKLFARPAILEERPKILYLRPYQGDPSLLVPVPQSFSSNTWVHSRANLISRTTDSLEVDVKRILTLLSAQKLPSSVLPDNGSSVARLIFLALAQGFHDIVLVGVDLDSRPHFWFAQNYVEKYSKYVALFPPPDSLPHGTSQAIDRPAGTLDFISTVNHAINEFGLGQIWAGSPSSQLSSRIPTYPWPSHGSQ